MEKEMIRLEHISKKFGDDLVLREINASLHRGEILGFLGPSGAGKTTTIKIITGQLRLRGRHISLEWIPKRSTSPYTNG